MKKQVICTFVGVLMTLASASNIQGEIVETNEISTIASVADKDSLVLFNVTDTLYSPSTTFGSNQWRKYFAERAEKNISDEKLRVWLIDKIKKESITIPKKPVEAGTSELISNLQNQSIPVLGITKKKMSTTYANNFGAITRDHILSVGINLEKTLNYYTVQPDENSKYDFAYGIIFTSKQPVGETMVSFLKRVTSKPTKVVMIDNSKEALELTEAALANSGIAFKGFRYGRSDSRKQAFDPVLGIIQFLVFEIEGRVMSDAEALQVKLDHPQENYEARLDDFLKFLNDAYTVAMSATQMNTDINR